ncbi:uncharacterized protein PODANS_6_8320, partial [Podospora anserina S mat+]
WEGAEKLFVKVMETRKTKLGADHLATLTSMGNLSSILWNRGRWKEADKLFVQVMETSFREGIRSKHGQRSGFQVVPSSRCRLPRSKQC